jgi:hypothetical protein
MMTLRELLQIELWSKRTTVKIVVISAVALVLCFGSWRAYYRYWITLGVREHGGKALAQIDELQRLSASCDAGFKAKEESADRELKIADQKERTFRDITVLFQLMDYFESTRLKHLRICNQDRFGAIEKRHPDLKNLDDQMLSSEDQLKRRLHSELD